MYHRGLPPPRAPLDPLASGPVGRGEIMGNGPDRRPSPILIFSSRRVPRAGSSGSKGSGRVRQAPRKRCLSHSNIHITITYLIHVKIAVPVGRVGARRPGAGWGPGPGFQIPSLPWGRWGPSPGFLKVSWHHRVLRSQLGSRLSLSD